MHLRTCRRNFGIIASFLVASVGVALPVVAESIQPGPAISDPVPIGDPRGLYAPAYHPNLPRVSFNAVAGVATTHWEEGPGVDEVDSCWVRMFSPVGERLGTVGAYAQLEGVLETPSCDRPVVVGHDFAGNIVLAWQARYPFGGGPSGIQSRSFDAAGTPLHDGIFIAGGQARELAVHPNGDFTVVWRASSVGETRARRFALDGTPLIAEATLDLPQPPLSDAGDDQRQIGGHADGSFTIAWASETPTGTDSDGAVVLARRFDADAMPVGDVIQVNTLTTGDQQNPALSTLSDGRFVVAWESAVSAGNDQDGVSIQARLFDSAGTPLGEEFQVNQYVVGEQHRPGVAFYSTDGELMVTWEGMIAEDQLGIAGRLFTGIGAALGNQVALVANTADTFHSFPRISSAGRGDVAVAWATTVEPDSGVQFFSGRLQYLAPDADADERSDNYDNCLGVTNPGQWNWDGDSFGDACDLCLGDDSFGGISDQDGDGVCSDLDCSHDGPAAAFVDSCGVCGGDGSTCDEERSVSNFPSNSEDLPALARRPDGSWVVAWQSDGSPGNDADDTSIQARLLSPSGQPLAGQFQVNGFTAGPQGRPAVAVAENGSFVIVWESAGSASTDNDGTSVQGRFFDAVGQPVTGDVQLNQNIVGGQLYARVAALPGDQFAIVWASEDAPSGQLFDISGRRFDVLGQATSDEVTINSLTHGNQYRPDIASVSEGSFVVAWGTDNGVAGEGDIRARRFTGWQQPFPNFDFALHPYSPALQLAPSVAMANDGSFAVGWNSFDGDASGRSVWARDFDGAGEPLSDPFRLNAWTLGDQTGVELLLPGDGSILSFWQSAGSLHSGGFVPSIQGRRFEAGGGLTSQAYQVSRISAGEPQVNSASAITANGGLVVVWASGFENDRGLRWRRFAGPRFFNDGFESGNTSAWATTVTP